MPRVCTICAHERREVIEKAMLDNVPYRDIALREKVGVMALQRHKNGGHIAQRLAQAQAAQEVSQADDLLTQVRGLQAEAHRIKDKAEKAGDLKTALASIAQLVKIIELLAKLRGQLAQENSTTVTVNVEPKWETVQAVLWNILAPYPDIRVLIAEGLKDVA